MSDSNLPLANLRVLDLTMLVPGPYCSRILTDFGAEVIKVEQPGGGDWLRHMPPMREGVGLLFHALNRGKKSICLNLKSEEGRDLFTRLAESADVVLEGFRPDVMDRLGLGSDALCRANPRLIYCTLSGYGQESPYRDRAGHDLNYIGLAGLLDLTGPREGKPVVPGTLIADLAGGLWAALGILMAITARARSGQGTRVDGSLFSAALSLLPIAVARQAGDQPMARGASDLTGGVICYHVYETQDGRYVTLAALEAKFWEAFCEAVERPDLIAAHFSPTVPGNPAFEAVQSIFRSRTREAWSKFFAHIDACCEPVYSLEEALSAGPVRALKMLDGASILPPIDLSGFRVTTSQVSPLLGEHTEDLLAEAGIEASALPALREKRVI